MALSNRKKLLLSILIIIFPFLLGEIALRLIMDSNTVMNINLGGMKEYHPTRGTQLIKNYIGGNYTINSKGFIGKEFSESKQAGVKRILSIGNSVTFSPPHQNYSSVLEDILADSLDDQTTEVIIGAVPGYSSYEALDWCNESLFDLDPNIVLIYIGWNDMGQYHPFGLRYKNIGKYQKSSKLSSLLQNIYLLRIGYFFKGRAEKKLPIDYSELTELEKDELNNFYPEHYEENLIQMISTFKQKGSEVLLISLTGLISLEEWNEDDINKLYFPRNLGKKIKLYKAIHQKYEQALNKVSTLLGVKVIDISALIKNAKLRKSYFTDTMHVTPEGAKRLGELISHDVIALLK